MIEYYHIHNTFRDGEKVTVDKMSTANLQCMCDDLYYNYGRARARKHKYSVEIEGEEPQSMKLCDEYLYDDMWLMLIDLIIPLIVICSNIVLKHVAIILFGWVGFKNKTINVSKIQNAVFVMLYFNTAISILIINANF